LPNFFSKWGKAILSWYTPTFLHYKIVTFGQVQQLLANPAALQQLIQSVGGDMGEEGEEGEEGLPDDFGGMEEHAGQQQLVQLTPAEEASVRRITELGFPFQRAVEVRL